MGATFTVSEVRRIMDKRTNIRNMSVIAHVDHGKSTLTDSLIAKAGLIAKAKSGDARFMDTRDDEQERSITIKSTSVSLLYDLGTPEDIAAKEPYLVNLIDSPGHVDFSSEVTTALRTTDGALVVVDCVEGVCTQTETVLRQALVERVKPVLFINKVDRVLSELGWGSEVIYKNFREKIENVNMIIETYADKALVKKMGSLGVDPTKGTVGFGSGLHAWAFTLDSFVRRNYPRDPKKHEYLTKRVWGDYFWSEAGKKFSKDPSDGPRSFNKFVMDPIIDLFARWGEERPSKQREAEREELLKKFKIEKTREFLNAKKTKEKIKTLFYTWLPAGESLVQMIVWKLPSPIEAARYRINRVYGSELPLSELEEHEAEAQRALEASAENKAMEACDPKGPLMIYISKMIPSNEPGRFHAFGRIFSGTVLTGEDVTILADGNAKPIQCKVQKVCLMMGRYTETLSSCPAGNMVGLTGVDKYILKSATICRDPLARPFKAMSFSVAPVVNQSVCPKNPNDIPKLLEGLKRLSKSDPLLKITSNHKTGETVLGCAGELHLEICLKDLREEYCKGIEILVSNPIVTYTESISEPSSKPEVVCSKSANKHNRLFFKAWPLGDELVEDIIEGKVSMEQDPKERARYLTEHHGWEKGKGRKVWSLGHPEFAKCNMLLDSTKSLQNLNEVKDGIVTAFNDYTSAGVLCEETVRGVCFELMDAQLHVDSTHRGTGQMGYCAKKAFSGAMLAADPSIIEPVFTVEIQLPETAMTATLAVLNQVKGLHTNTIIDPNSPMIKVIAELPVANSFGFCAKLREATHGKAFPTMKMDKWQKVDGKVITEKESQAKNVVMEIRERKGLSKSVPCVKDFHEPV